MTYTAQTSTHTVTTTPAPNKETPVPSIRQIICTGLVAGKTTKEIAAEVQAAHPASAAAAKSVKHIAWYKADMKKNPNTYKAFRAE